MLESWMCGFQGTDPVRFPVATAKGIHLFPYRTQKLSLSAPMVLGWRRPGRAGGCQIPFQSLRTLRKSVIGAKTGTWGCSSVGRAPALQAGGQEFEPLHLHRNYVPKQEDSGPQLHFDKFIPTAKKSRRFLCDVSSDWMIR